MKHKLVFILLLINSLIFGQINFNQGTLNLKDYYEVIPYQTEIGKIIIPVTINDKTYRFLLDTGAPNLFAPELLKELNITEGDSINVSDSNNQGQKMKFAVVPQLKIGNLIFENQAGLIYNFEEHNLLSCYKIDGFIGSNPVSIKPHTYLLKPELLEKIESPIIFYEKIKTGLKISFPEDLIK